MAVFSASAPGKVILFGEHAVVHGASCIAASIDLRTSVSVHLPDVERQDAAGPSEGGGSTDEVILELPGLELEWRWQLEELRPYLQSSDGKGKWLSNVNEGRQFALGLLAKSVNAILQSSLIAAIVAGM